MQAFPNVLTHIPGSTNTAPTVSLVSPTAGTTIAGTTPVVFDVLDAEGMRRVVVVARFPALGLEEVIYRGSGFSSLYTGSTTSTVSGGTRFSVLRRSGWPADPAIDVYAIDTGGLEA